MGSSQGSWAMQRRESGMRPIFIGGTGRSGTSIVRRVLESHESIAGAGSELRFIVDPGGVLDFWDALTDRWSPYAADSAIHDLRWLMRACSSRNAIHVGVRRACRLVGVSPPRYRHAAVMPAETVDAVLDGLLEELGVEKTRAFWLGSPPWQPRPTFYECGPFGREPLAVKIRMMLDRFFAHLSPGRSPCCWVEDTPFNMLAAAELIRLFPDMRLICVQRDLRDVVASHVTKDWGGSLSAVARRVRREVLRWNELRVLLPAVSVLEVSLEAAVSDRVAFGEEVSRFLDLDVRASFSSPESRFSAAGANVGRWEGQLDEGQKREVMAILGDLLATDGAGLPGTGGLR